MDKAHGFGNGFIDEHIDINAADRNAQGLFFEPGTFAVGTLCFAHKQFQFRAGPVAGRFFVSAFKIVYQPLKIRHIGAASVFIATMKRQFSAFCTIQ
ncbi:hypothetical protein SDC9_145112 [bioreactor metagenome]|uniref:Uncharacterized protein n=1 Tax=bioreactor metagenome TaxID=1076179 RepID=A0A645EB96_9ZZZZ